MILGDIPEAYIDAESDAEYAPENFAKGFYDYKGYLNKLTNLDGPVAFISGRKGTGKSAYIYKIKSENPSLYLDLAKIPYKSFQKISDSGKVEGNTLPYNSVWMMSLISSMATSPVFNNNILNGLDKVSQIIAIAESLGLSGDFNDSITIAAKKSFKVQLPKIIEYLSESEKKPVDSVRDLSDVLFKLFREIRFKNSVYLLIDGVDDILNTNVNKSQVLGSLFTTIRDLNLAAKNSAANYKILMAVRSDIWDLVNTPDMNKLKQTNQVMLDWYTGDNSELAGLLNKRLEIVPEFERIIANSDGDKLILWNKFFPQTVKLGKRNTESWNFFLEHTLYRPRDVIQLLNEAKDSYGSYTDLSARDFKNLINEFSKDYFFDEMKNELSGFVSESLLADLPKVLQALGRDGFKYSNFRDKFMEFGISHEEAAIKSLLITMFDKGYIGQRTSVADRYAFKHKNSRQQINLANSLVTHRGFYAAIAIDN